MAIVYGVLGVIVILTAGTFGTITSTRAGINMRELQFSLKIIF